MLSCGWLVAVFSLQCNLNRWTLDKTDARWVLKWLSDIQKCKQSLKSLLSNRRQLYQIQSDLLLPFVPWANKILLNAPLRYNSAVKTPPGDVKSFMCEIGALPASAFPLHFSQSELLQLWLRWPLLKGTLDVFIGKVSSNGTQLQHLTTHRWVTPFKIIVCPSKTNAKGRDIVTLQSSGIKCFSTLHKTVLSSVSLFETSIFLWDLMGLVGTPNWQSLCPLSFELRLLWGDFWAFKPALKSSKVNSFFTAVAAETAMTRWDCNWMREV